MNCVRCVVVSLFFRNPLPFSLLPFLLSFHLSLTCSSTFSPSFFLFFFCCRLIPCCCQRTVATLRGEPASSSHVPWRGTPGLDPGPWQWPLTWTGSYLIDLVSRSLAHVLCGVDSKKKMILIIWSLILISNGSFAHPRKFWDRSELNCKILCQVIINNIQLPPSFFDFFSFVFKLTSIVLNCLYSSKIFLLKILMPLIFVNCLWLSPVVFN